MSSVDVKFPKERQQLLKMVEADQKIRREGIFNEVETILEMNRIDLANQKKLMKILDKVKLPTTKNIGYDGAEAVWLIAQHAGYNLQLMEDALKLIKISTRNSTKNGYYRGIPYLEDRINILRGKPQIYGTQFWNNSLGNPIPYPIKNEHKLEINRKKFGLGSFKKYKKDIINDAKRVTSNKLLN